MTTWRPFGSELPQYAPTQTATTTPIVYWPWPPMLKSPQRKANATARPVKTNVVVRSSVCVKLNVDEVEDVGVAEVVPRTS